MSKKAVRALTVAQASYIAGLIDGEGHIEREKHKGTIRAVVVVTQAEKGREVLD